MLQGWSRNAARLRLSLTPTSTAASTAVKYLMPSSSMSTLSRDSVSSNSTRQGGRCQPPKCAPASRAG